MDTFQQVLTAMGENDTARAQRIKELTGFSVTERTVRAWRKRLPRLLQIIKSSPDLANALADEARRAS